MDTPQHRNAIAHHATWDQANGQGTSCDAMLFWPMPCHDRTSVSTATNTATSNMLCNSQSPQMRAERIELNPRWFVWFELPPSDGGPLPLPAPRPPVRVAAHLLRSVHDEPDLPDPALLGGLMVSVTGSAAGGGGGCCRFLSAGAAAFAAAGAFTARFGAPSPALRGFLGAFFLCLPPMRPMPPLS
eukprot:CAMPEP_0181215722 /NCGR_PEP_ID=MMETSP1096-20121128/26170_1 /TAXON_ID=156174 ORGANISM="Chrysochromulina ericina, Strain CCMP281" /NCGR_SAMPLE_ID=MMETSP1096 /ASSEMBLY_ACC=CAM_ASM_000453 /LENGTH=185 /DNA_ID=CAMNT_0023307607 /DNA_START=76 /DNA_END=631 /DNA_ORIENTATION=-